MESEQQKGMMSGATTPDYPKTPKATSSVGRLRRSDSEETLLTAIDEVESIASYPSLEYPNPPLNSPITMSEVGDRELPNPNSLADKLNAMPSNLADVTPPTSVEGSAERIERIPRAERDATPTPAKTRSTKRPPASIKDLFPEHSTWAQVAEEDVSVGLKRLAMLARDEHERDPTKPAERFYAERLVKLIKDGEMYLDLSLLQ